jgi:glutamine---fructose-6-phosphate transaminase (isomerizing)
VIAPAGRTLASMRVALEKVRERGAEVIAISDDETFLAESDTALPLVSGVPEWLTPLLTVVPGQVAAVRLATLREVDVDSPAGLTKITLTH